MTGLVLPLPQRHQRSRRAGWKKPLGAVIVDRTSKRWGNPFKVGEAYPTTGGLFGAVNLVVVDRAHAAFAYQQLLRRSPGFVRTIQRELTGRDVCCACPLDDACHGDIIRACAARLPEWDVIPPHSLRIILDALSRAA